MIEDDLLLKVLPERVNANERLVWQGRHVSTVLLLEVGEAPYLIEVERGRIASVRRGPFVMPRWSFALRTDADAWATFLLALPPPGFHDLMALVKSRRLRVEGDLHPFMSNLLYFKSVLASPRASGAAS